MAQTLRPQPLVFPMEVKLPCTFPRGGTVEHELIYTVCRSSEEQIKAWKELDTEALKGSRTGTDLANNIREIELMRSRNQYKDPTLHRLVIAGVTVGEATAQVKTSEMWSVMTYNKADNSIVDQQGAATYRETYELVKIEGKWLIEKVEFETATAPGD